MDKKFKCILFAFLALVLATVACSSGAPLSESTPHPQAPTQDSSVLPGAIAKVSQGDCGMQNITPLPVPEPPLSGPEKMVILANGFGVFIQLHPELKEKINTTDGLESVYREYMEKEIQMGDKAPKKIKSIYDELTLEERDAIAVSRGVLTAGFVLLNGKRTTCDIIFEALYWVATHFAGGEDWFFIGENMYGNHPVPEINGKRYNWERLVDILDEQCPGYRVTWRGSGVEVRKLKRTRLNDRDYISTELNPELLVPIAITAAAVVAIGIVVLVPGAAPVAVLLVL